MDSIAVRDAVERVQCALGLKHRPVGVRFLFDAEEFAAAPAPRLPARMPYCVMVKRAMRGHALKAELDDFGCRAAARSLGLIPPDELFLSGRHSRRLGLYRDLAVAKQVRQRMTLCQHAAHGVELMPLEEFRQEPDVVLLAGTPYQAMRLVQGYSHQFGVFTGYKMAGNQALCSELTAYPLENDCLNVSMLCAGTRFMAGWGDDELGLGLPFHRFQRMVDGLCATLDPTEPDRKKRRIADRSAACGRSDLRLTYGRNYYTGLYLTQKGRRKA